MPTIITAGDASNGAVVTPSNDGAVTIQTGAAGAKVNAIALAADGTMTLNKPMAGGSLTLGTAQNTTSGTAIDFTSIPSWVKRITVMFNGVSTNGASAKLIQIGSGSIQTTGYSSTGVGIAGTTNATSSTAGFVINSVTATDTLSGSMVINLVSANTFVSGHFCKSSNAWGHTGAGDVTLSGTLDRLRLTTVNGTDTFDAGSVNILYEG